MSTSVPNTPAARPNPGRHGLLFLLLTCAVLALGLAGWHYFTADDAVLPAQPVAQLAPVPLTVGEVAVGLTRLPVQANGYLITQTHDVAGPFLRTEAAFAFLGLLGVALAYFLAVVSGLTRPFFVAGMALVIFLLMSLNADLLGIFDASQQYFLILTLAVLGLPAYYLHAFRPEVPISQRILLFGVLVLSMGALLFGLNPNQAEVTALHLTAFVTMAGAVAVVLLVLWVAFENVYGLLWLNTQSDSPAGRFGLFPFLLASGLYLGTLFLYYWNNGEVLLFPGWHLDPLVLLLPAVLISWFGLKRRAATYGPWVSYHTGMRYLYPVLVVFAAAALGYALATANDPLLMASRDFTALAFLCVGVAFLLYVLLNFGPLLRKKLPVYRVAYEPRRLPFYAMYTLGIVLLGLVLLRNNFSIVDQVRAGYYNNLGDLARLQSELQPDDLSQALLAERYYAESDVLDQHNHKASLGRAALYRFRLQRQNEINILRRALSRRPSEKVSLRLAALYNEPRDFFDRLAVLRDALKAAPGSARLNGDMAQLYSRSTVTDSVEFYQERAEAAAPNSAVLQANRLAFLLRDPQLGSVSEFMQKASTTSDDALASNMLLAYHLGPTGTATPVWPQPAPSTDLTPAQFAHLYHAALFRVHAKGSKPAADTTYAPLLKHLNQRAANSDFHDQLTFLQAYTQHYGGRPVAAQTTLLPLATGSGPTTAYYQQLQGLWLLDQHLPAPAASRLNEARQNGATTAALPAAYALALSNRPDSAQRVIRQVLAGSEQSAFRAARRLSAVLSPELRTEYAQAPDSLRTDYLVLRGDELPAKELLPSAQTITTPALRETALLAQLPRAIQAGEFTAAQGVVQQFAPAPTAPGSVASAWNVRRGELLVQQQQWPQLQKLVDNASFTGFDVFYRLYFRAALAEAAKQPQDAARLYDQLVREAPFVETGLVAAANFHTRRRDFPAAYNTLLRGIDYNPESVVLLKAYVLAAIPVGLTEYASTPLEHLGALLSPADYATFRKEYETRRASRVASAAPWN
ncbi:tetratricopeptide repeat protein [Hymenobacter tenuis]